MGVLKRIGYILVSIVGLCVALGIGLVATALSSLMGFIVLGGIILFFIGAAVKEYSEKSSTTDTE